MTLKHGRDTLRYAPEHCRLENIDTGIDEVGGCLPGGGFSMNRSLSVRGCLDHSVGEGFSTGVKAIVATALRSR